jgi:hypothetical protein
MILETRKMSIGKSAAVDKQRVKARMVTSMAKGSLSCQSE